MINVGAIIFDSLDFWSMIIIGSIVHCDDELEYVTLLYNNKARSSMIQNYSCSLVENVLCGSLIYDRPGTVFLSYET